MSRKRIVILGAGYAGLGTALALDRNPAVRGNADVLIVDRNPYHLLKTELHAVATGLLPPSRAALPLNLLLKRGGVDSTCTEVKAVDADAGILETGGDRIAFDVLVAAPGGVINYYNIPGMQDCADIVTDLDPAMRVRSRVREMVKNVGQGASPARIVIVGAGAEGVEVAAYLMDRFVSENIPEPLRPRITLVEGAGLILPGGRYTKTIRRRARRRLERAGIRVRLNTRVRAAEPGRLIVQESAPLPYDMLLWAGGLYAAPLASEQLPAPLGPMRRVQVRDTLNLEGRDNIFVLGDAACFAHGARGKPLPAAAQYAVQQAEIAAHNIATLLGRGRMKPYVPEMRGEFVSLGNHEAVGWAGPLEMLGRDAQALKQGILAKYLLSIGVNPLEWFAGQGVFARGKN